MVKISAVEPSGSQVGVVIRLEASMPVGWIALQGERVPSQKTVQLGDAFKAGNRAEIPVELIVKP